MIINGVEYPDPDDFKINPRTRTNVRRALSGQVYGTRLERREELQLTFDTLERFLAQALANQLYEQTALGLLDLFVRRGSSSDILDCTNAFKGKVDYTSELVTYAVGPSYIRNVTFTFIIHTYETF